MGEQGSMHDLEAERARQSNDPTLIRQLYHSYGKELLESFAGRESEVTQHGSQRVAEWQGKHLPKVAPRGRALDVGCGPRPEASIKVARHGRSVVLSDISFGIVALARAVAQNEKLQNVQYVVADAQILPFAPGSFALVVADDVIEHVPRPERLTAECARVTAPDGLVSISTPNRRAVSVIVDRLRDLIRGRWEPREKYFLVTSHLREFTRGELRSLGRAYFRHVRFVSVGWDGGGVLKRLASLMTGWRPMRGLCRHWIALMRRPLPLSERAGG